MMQAKNPAHLGHKPEIRAEISKLRGLDAASTLGPYTGLLDPEGDDVWTR